MDEFDPASRDAPPARHLIESDSEDEEDWGPSARPPSGSLPSPKRTHAFEAPHIDIVHAGSRKAFTRSEMQAQPLVVLVGAVGEAYVRAQAAGSSDDGPLTCDVALLVDGEQQGAAGERGGTTVALLRLDAALLGKQNHFAHICFALHQTLDPSSIVIIDEYNALLYLADDVTQRREQDASLDAPLRFINGPRPALQSTVARPFSTPNYSSGIGASLLCEAAASGVPATMILVPQQEATTNPHLQAMQQHPADLTASALVSKHREAEAKALAPHLQRELVGILKTIRAQSSGSKASSNIPLDKFLQDRRSAARRKASKEVSSMYM